MLVSRIVKGSIVAFVLIAGLLAYRLKTSDMKTVDNSEQLAQSTSNEMHREDVQKAQGPDKPLAGAMQQKLKVIIYSTPTCPYCHEAKALLDHLRIRYEEKNVMEEAHREEMMKNTQNARGVPQIMIGSEHVGGYYELSELYRNGELVSKISGNK